MDAKRLSSLQKLGDGFKQTLPYQEGKEEILVNLSLGKLLINGNLYNFDDIIDCTINEKREEDVESTNLIRSIVEAEGGSAKTTTNTGSVIGRSIVGGIVGGVPGALIGGATASTTTTSAKDVNPIMVSDFSITFTTNDPTHPTEQIQVGENDKEASNLVNFFKIILSQKDKAVITNKYADKDACIKDLYETAQSRFLTIDINETIMYDENKTMMESRNDYRQLLVNTPNSFEIEFISNVMNAACDADFLYHHHGDYLYSSYLNDSRRFLSLISEKKESAKQKQLIAVFEKATDIIVHKLDGGYDNDRPYSFRLYIAEGDNIETELGTAFSDMALNMWKKGIKLHHDKAYGFKNVDFSTTVQMIQKYDPSYVEPQKAKADMGCMVLLSALIIITITLALL